jgi:mannose-6-phosphate isomerase-like protein (cupin superfamily)
MIGIVRAGTGETLLAGPVGAELLAGPAATGGAVSFVIHPLAPRALGSPVHTHKHEDEWSFVLDGEVGVQIGDETFVAGPGDLVLKPRGVPHAFWNPTDEPARLLEVITPGGFEEYFARLGELFRASPMPDPAELGRIAAEFGMDVDPTSIPRLAQAHELRLG